jgi:hypothetical protein
MRGGGGSLVADVLRVPLYSNHASAASPGRQNSGSSLQIREPVLLSSGTTTRQDQCSSAHDRENAVLLDGNSLYDRSANERAKLHRKYKTSVDMMFRAFSDRLQVPATAAGLAGRGKWHAVVDFGEFGRTLTGTSLSNDASEGAHT